MTEGTNTNLTQFIENEESKKEIHQANIDTNRSEMRILASPTLNVLIIQVIFPFILFAIWKTYPGKTECDTQVEH